MKNIGLYLHIPFCKSKCPYCDFYSFSGKETEKDQYTKALNERILSSISTLQRKGDTLYIGGGTPSVLGAENLKILVGTCKNGFLTDDAEITVECNPGSDIESLIPYLKKAGVNRLSIGAQSSDAKTLKILGRTHTPDDTKNAVKTARRNMELTQLAVANSIDIDCRTVLNIENCKGNPKMEVLYPLIRTLHIDPWDVFYPSICLPRKDAAA